MREVAKRAGVSTMTVSRALRNHSEISEETRVRIREIAEEIGYSKNPLVSALMTQRSSGKAVNFSGVIAHVHCFPYGYKVRRNLTSLRDGIQRQAKEIGYGVEEFFLNEPGMTPRRLVDILKNRGIHGVIFEHFFHKDVELDIDLSELAAVAIMHTLTRPNLNRIIVNEYQSVVTANEELKKLGYQRIGMALPTYQEGVAKIKRSAAWLQQQTEIPEDQRIPILYHDSPHVAPEDFKKWFNEYRPDAIVGLSRAIPKFVKEMGYELGQDIGYTQFGWSEEDTTLAGVDPNWRQVGMTAINQVVDQMNRNEFGVPTSPLTTMIEGRWVPGPTVAVQERQTISIGAES